MATVIEGGLLLWLAILSGMCLLMVGMLALVWQRLHNLPSIREVELNEKLDAVIRIASSDTAIKNDTIRRKVQELLYDLEQDPIASEKHWTRIHSLRTAVEQ